MLGTQNNLARNKPVSRPSSRPAASSSPAMPNRGFQSNQGRSKNADVSIDGVYRNPRLTFHLTTLIGCSVDVQVKNGKIFQGIFKTFSPELEVVLELAHQLDLNDSTAIPSREQVLDKLIINFNDIVLLSAINADTKYAKTDAFTDAAISRNHNGAAVKEKALQPWEGDGELGHVVGLEEESARGWTPEDMFRHNEEKFGVHSSYNENMHEYTIPLERQNTTEYIKREQEAAKTAAEIEASSASKMNSVVENGGDVDDEEAQFSAVRRPNSQLNRRLNDRSTDRTSERANERTVERIAERVQEEPSMQKKYIPPNQRHQPAAHQTQGAPHRGSSPHDHEIRLNGRDNPTNKPLDRTKSSPQSKNTNTVRDLQKFQQTFKISYNSPEPGSASGHEQKPNKSPSKPEPRPEQPSPKKVQDKPDSQQPSKAAAVSAEQPNADVSPVVSTAAVSPAPGTALNANPAKTSTTASTAAPTTIGASTVYQVPPDIAAVASKSKLNPEAAEFVSQRLVVSPAAPGNGVYKTKSATVSVETRQQRQDIPTAQQAMGPPLISPQPQFMQFHQSPALINSRGAIMRVNSHPGPDGPQMQPQQYGMQAFIPMPVMPYGPGQGQMIPQQGNMPPAAQPNHQPGTGPSGQPGTHPGMSLSGSHQSNPLYQGAGFSGATNQYIYTHQPQQPAPPQGSQQPPLQPSPHNPSPSPVTMPGPYSYAPPPSFSTSYYNSQHSAGNFSQAGMHTPYIFYSGQPGPQAYFQPGIIYAHPQVQGQFQSSYQPPQ